MKCDIDPILLYAALHKRVKVPVILTLINKTVLIWIIFTINPSTDNPLAT